MMPPMTVAAVVLDCWLLAGGRLQPRPTPLARRDRAPVVSLRACAPWLLTPSRTCPRGRACVVPASRQGQHPGRLSSRRPCELVGAVMDPMSRRSRAQALTGPGRTGRATTVLPVDPLLVDRTASPTVSAGPLDGGAP